MNSTGPQNKTKTLAFYSVGTGLLACALLAILLLIAQFKVEYGKSHGHNRELSWLTFSKEQFSRLEWRENGKEFLLNGTMYDVEEVRQDKNQYHLLVFPDHTETTLMAIWTGRYRSAQDASAAGNQFLLLLFPFSQHQLVELPALQWNPIAALKGAGEYRLTSFIGLLHAPPPEC